MAVKQINRAVNISEEQFWSDFVEPGVPVVIQDAACDWPAVHTWTPDYFIRHSGDLNVIFKNYNPSQVFPASMIRSEGLLRDYIRSFPNRDPFAPYFGEKRLGETFSDLVGDVGGIRYSGTSPDNLILMISSGTTAAMHFHAVSEAISYQITGSRKFFLLPPDEAPLLQPCAPTDVLWNFGKTLFDESNVYSYAGQVFEAELTPGQAIYIPVHWWHTVLSSLEISTLLCDFFVRPRHNYQKNAVVRHIEETVITSGKVIQECEEAFRSDRAPKDVAQYYEKMISALNIIGEVEKEREYIEKALALNCAASEVMQFWRDRLKDI